MQGDSLIESVVGVSQGNISNSNLSLSSDGVESDDSAKPRLRGNFLVLFCEYEKCLNVCVCVCVCVWKLISSVVQINILDFCRSNVLWWMFKGEKSF